MNLRLSLLVTIITAAAVIRQAWSCSAGFGGLDGRIVTNPTMSWTMHPPVSWTYPDANAIQDLSYLPGQSLTKAEAQNAANGDITAAALEAIASLNLPTFGVVVRPNYSPPLVNDCVKSALANNAAAAVNGANLITQTGPGEQFGIVEQGSVMYLASSTITITNVVCSTRSFGSTNPLSLTPFIQGGSVTIEGLTLSSWQQEQVAAKMMAILSFNFNVKFVTEMNAN